MILVRNSQRRMHELREHFSDTSVVYLHIIQYSFAFFKSFQDVTASCVVQKLR